MNIDENGINIKVSSYKDVYLAIINKIIDIIYNKKSVNKDWTFDYESKRYRSIEEKSLNYLGNVIKPDGNGNDNKERLAGNNALCGRVHYGAVLRGFRGFDCLLLGRLREQSHRRDTRLGVGVYVWKEALKG